MSRIAKLLSTKFTTVDTYQVPEVPTILQLGGCKYPGLGKASELLAFEQSILSAQLAFEDSFLRVASSKSPSRSSVVLLDRAAFDLVSYMGDPTGGDLWTATMHGMTPPQSESSLGSRYDNVIFLRSAAVGTSFYTTANNHARTETADEARALDAKTELVYRQRFPSEKLHFIENPPEGFDAKMQSVERCVEALVGVHFSSEL